MSTTITKLRYLAGATHFRSISEKLYVDGDRVYSEAGINFKASWFPVYYVLAIADSPLTIMQISKQIDFTHITVKNVIKELEKVKLVTVIPNPIDKRSKLVSLSTRGQKMIYRLKPLWISFSTALKNIFHTGHPDFINILTRIDQQIEKNSILNNMAHPDLETINIVDYRPSLSKRFYDTAGSWVTSENNGNKEGGDEIQLPKLDKTHFLEGGFIFYALNNDQIVGFAALKRLGDKSFECSSLLVSPGFQNNGVYSKLIDRCVSRCLENEASHLWIQTSPDILEKADVYDRLGFKEKKAPPYMKVMEQNGKVMCLEL